MLALSAEKKMARFVRRAGAACVWVALAGGVFACSVYLWAAGGPPFQLLDTTGQDYYQNCFSLLGLSEQKLVEAIPQLRGLVPAASQKQLPRILSEVGKNVEDYFQAFTQVVATEQVTRARCGPRGRLGQTSRREFTYLFTAHIKSGQAYVREYRAEANGTRVPFSPVSGPAEGFAAMWMLLLPGNQSGSNFRYLGQQQVDGHRTDVIAFAQRPGWSSVVGFFNVGGRRVLLLQQGVIWVDKATNDLLKIRAYLLKPRLEVGLEQQITEIQFGEVHVSYATAGPLLLPLRMTLTTMERGHVLREVHIYSNYKLPAATFKIDGARADARFPQERK
jgi:hypothetical protein